MRFKVGSRKIEIYIPDMFFREMIGDRFNRYDIVVRYLAIENYFSKNDFGFDLYRKMQELRIGEGYGEKAVRQFQELLKSYQENGYDKTSCITLNNTLGLLDGSHRIATNIYFHEPMISALILKVNRQVDFSLDWFIANNFTHYEIDTIRNKAYEITQELIRPFLCIVWSLAINFADDIAEDLKYFGVVSGIKHYSYSEAEYANIVRAVYSIDDIEKWKVEKKIQYMLGRGGDIAVISLIINSLEFRVKASSRLPLSRYLERVKATIRTKYKSRIQNYFHDICFHVGDNYLQNSYIRCVFEPEIDMNGIISIMNHYKYALVKTDVPYMPEDFPGRIPVGKDADILCSVKIFEELTNEVEVWCRKNTTYDIRTIIETSGKRVRMELYGRLIYQIDISCRIPGLEDSFTNDALECRKYNGKYYILSPAYEYVYRIFVYSKNKSKKYHLEYLKRHSEDYVPELVEKYSHSKLDIEDF